MVLSKQDIIQECTSQKLIEDFDSNNFQTCSYDLTFSGEYYLPEDDDQVVIKTLGIDAKLMIPADAICYLITKETVNIPNDLTASISLAFGLIKKGVMLSAQPPYDPGYKGKTVALLHNLSDKPVEICKDDHILNIIFERLSSRVDNEDLYKGQYNNLNSLAQYCNEVRRGGVYKLMQDLDVQKRDLDTQKKDMEKQRKKTGSFIPTLMTITSIIIAIVTFLITLIATSNIFIPILQPTKENKVDSAATSKDVFSFTIPSGSKNQVIIYVDDHAYQLDFDSATVQMLDQTPQDDETGE